MNLFTGSQLLATKNPQASRRAGQAIQQQLLSLEVDPKIGRPLDDPPELRELIIPFADSRYVALYRHEIEADSIDHRFQFLEFKQ